MIEKNQLNKLTTHITQIAQNKKHAVLYTYQTLYLVSVVIKEKNLIQKIINYYYYLLLIDIIIKLLLLLKKIIYYYYSVIIIILYYYSENYSVISFS